tara:strand:+ start:7734 stop:8132 length:399 start_codon:yes stop_codon:yes gene_type:complete
MPHYVEGKEAKAPNNKWTDLEKKVRDTKTRAADIGTIAAQVAQQKQQEKDPEQYFLPTMEDMVNHPKHYNKHGVECIDAIRATLTDDEFRGYCKGNVLKYTWRERYKNGLEDLQKAQWYLERVVNDIRQDKS